jgi:hypothetical protein
MPLELLDEIDDTRRMRRLVLGRDGRLTISRLGEAVIAYHRCPPVPRAR